MFIIILLNILVVFQINNYKVRELFFLINNLIILLLHFNIKIFKVIDSNIANYFCIIIY